MLKLIKRLFCYLFVILLALGTAACEGFIAERPAPEPEEPGIEDPSEPGEDNPSEPGEDDPNEPGEDPQPDGSIADDFDCISIAEAIEIAIESGSTVSAEQYYVYGVIESISNGTYGAMTITDGTDSLYVYGVYSADGETRYDAFADKPAVGDEVVLKGAFKVHNEVPEMDRGYLQAFKHVEVEVDDSQYEEMTIESARDAEVGTLLKVTGVVAQITYANGYVPNGFFLVDNTNSIYVYGTDVSAVISEGNEVTLIGEKTYFVLESEVANAEKFGYKGCCQIQNAQIVSNDKGNNAYDKSWIQESDIKTMMETPVTENMTTTIFKVNALVSKVEGTGFINYYFNDIDGITGSYTYTACNGGDFAWLDEFDGKICTVYLTAINCKSTTSGCFYRFVPIEVIDENYTFDKNDAAEFALKYFAVDQFLPEYKANPQAIVLTSVSSELLGFENVVISYSSDNEAVVNFVETAEGLVLNTLEAGTAKITITATYNGIVKEQEVVVTVSEADQFETITIAEAIATPDDTEVTVKGIVLSSLVNKTGFYIIDETGVIAVQTTADDCATVKPGDEVIIKGTKDHKVDEGKTCAGQINLFNSVVVANNYGNHEIPTNTYDYSKDFKYLYDLDATEDHTTQVYVVKGTVVFTGTAFSTNVALKSEDGKTTLSLYCSGAAQYEWLKQFEGEVVEFEIAMCNWNNKDYYRGCVIAVNHNGERVVNTLNFE